MFRSTQPGGGTFANAVTTKVSSRVTSPRQMRLFSHDNHYPSLSCLSSNLISGSCGVFRTARFNLPTTRNFYKQARLSLLHCAYRLCLEVPYAKGTFFFSPSAPISRSCLASLFFSQLSQLLSLSDFFPLSFSLPSPLLSLVHQSPLLPLLCKNYSKCANAKLLIRAVQLVEAGRIKAPRPESCSPSMLYQGTTISHWNQTSKSSSFKVALLSTWM